MNEIKTYKGLKYKAYFHTLDGGRSGMAFFCGYVRLPYNHPYRKFCLEKKDLSIYDLEWKARKMLAEQKGEEFTDPRPKKQKPRYVFVGYEKMNIQAHGGLTFSRRFENSKSHLSKGNWIGWDYGHAGDEMWVDDIEKVNPVIAKIHRSYPGSGDKRWTEKEVEQHCKNVIDQVLRIK